MLVSIIGQTKQDDTADNFYFLWLLLFAASFCFGFRGGGGEQKKLSLFQGKMDCGAWGFSP